MRQYFDNWNVIRVVRLALGLAILAQGILTRQWMVAGLGGMFTLLPLLNVGCCGVSGCQTAPPARKGKATEDITYEEVR